MTHRRWLLIAAFLGAIGSAEAADRPVVVELFTSQGCSSCPPAEAFLLDLVRDRPDVLALAFHVDYWDRLGWKDPFSSASATSRQRAYSKALGVRGVYTPQMVVDGRKEAIGSNRGQVLAAINAARGSRDSVPVELSRDGGQIAIELGAGSGTATAWLVGFDPERTTEIPRGENAGRTIRQANVVRSVASVADWRGGEMKLTRPAPAGKKTALILQAPDGRIVGAALLGT
ncbi:MAG: DUF1223 domain-containing protein [Rhizobiales bacterium]|nr:DUF1223 domain-containing protein [Hyphomicrobiales bacterium]